MEKNKLLLRTNLLKNIRSFSTKKEELYNLLKILQEGSTAAGDIEIANVEKIGEAEEKNEEIKKELREQCELKVTLKGIEGQEAHPWAMAGGYRECHGLHEPFK